MANNLRPGCAKTPSGRYMPVVFETHGRVFFSGETFAKPDVAIEYAMENIKELTYQYWHNHALTDSHHA